MTNIICLASNILQISILPDTMLLLARIHWMHPNEDIVRGPKHFVVFCGVGNELVSPQGEPQVGLNVGLDNNDIKKRGIFA